ncbi:MAG: SPOR domain-containing protein [Ignavibacteria bacterium]|nr:SPOR domain-containing protein [Ignavibacteria bacterium]
MIFRKANIIPLTIIITLLHYGCSSVEYEREDYEVTYEEKAIVTDTIKTLVDKEEEPIKTDIDKKEKYTYVVQIGAFAIESNFQRFYQRARLVLGNDVYYELVGNLYKIRIGNFTNRAEAIKLAELCKAKGYYDAFIITRKN